MSHSSDSRKRKTLEVDGKFDSPAEAMSDDTPPMKRARTALESDLAPSETLQLAIDRANTDSQMDENSSDGEGWKLVETKHRKNLARKGVSQRISSEVSGVTELTFHRRQQVPIRIEDLQNLVLYTLADGVSPSWLAIKNAKQVKSVVVIMVPGLEKAMFDSDATVPSTHPSMNEDPRTKPQSIAASEAFAAWKGGGTSVRPSTYAGAPLKLCRDTLAQPLQPMATVFTHMWPVKCPGDSKYSRIHSPLQAMLVAPYPKPMENKNMKGPKPPAEEKHFKPQPTTITQLIHTVEELREAEYPIHPASFNNAEDAALEQSRRSQTHQSIIDGWVDSNVTQSMPSLSDDSARKGLLQGLDVYSLDCEMVLTTDDVYSLARISLVSHTGTTIMDKYVLPSLPVKDYYTQFSGITPELLASTTTTLEDIQQELLTLLTPSTILLGHSLNSDLCALKMTHPFLVDTSIIYPHPRGLPLRSSLKFLAQKYLRREIQAVNFSRPGHDSVEDAKAVLDLVKLKCEKGAKWGTSEASGEPIWRRLHRAGKKGAMVEYGTPERGLGKEADVTNGCENDAQVVQGVIDAANGNIKNNSGPIDFVWARLRELEFARGWAEKPNYPSSNGNRLTSTNGQSVSEPSFPPVPSSTNNNTDGDPESLPSPDTSVLANTITHIQTLHSNLPKGSLLIVYSGTGRSSHRLSELHAQLNTYKREFKTKKWDDLSVRWTDGDEREMRSECDAVRNGLGFVCVT